MAKKHFDYLLEYNDVRRWHDNLSTIWSDVALRVLGRFTEDTKISPKQFVALSEKEMADVTQDYIQKMLKAINPKSSKPYSPGYVDNVLTGIKSWASYNDKPIKRKIKIENSDSTPTLESERAPMPDELRRVLYDARTDDRTRVSLALIAFSGPRPEVEGNFLGTDGLRIRDFPEMRIEKGKVDFIKVPTMMKVKASLSKTHKAYFTFLNEEGCQLLKVYLDRRMENGEALTPDSGIVVSNSSTEVMQARFGIVDNSPF
ncbi:MAG: hypothetical protein JRN15_01115 [Nitrososphaerota archaeon]|nr:hypothetical protein [Nitrososphaerota archaeon]